MNHTRRDFLLTTLALAAPPTPRFPELLWTIDLRSASYGGGAVGDLEGNGKPAIVFGTYFNDEHLYCVDAGTGAVRWKFKSEAGPWDASVALADLDADGKLEILAADSSTGTLFCLDPAGKVVWKHKLPNSTDSPPSVADLDGDGKLEIVAGTMLLGDKHGRVVALEAATHKVKWTARVPGHIQSEPTLVDLDGDKLPEVIVTSWRGSQSVHALSGTTGKELWSVKMLGDMYHGVSVLSHKGTFLVASSIAGDVALIDAKGKVVWSKKVGGYLFGPTTVADLDGDGVPKIVVAGPGLTVLDIKGNEVWKGSHVGSVSRGVAVADLDGDGLPDLVYGGHDRKFRAVVGRTGKELWTFDATVQGHVYEWLDGAPIVGDFDGDGLLEVFFVAGKGTSDATRKKNYGRAYCLKAGRGKGGWPMFRGNLRRTGAV